MTNPIPDPTLVEILSRSPAARTTQDALRADFAFAIEEVRRLGAALRLEAIHIWADGSVGMGIGLYSPRGIRVDNYGEHRHISVQDLLNTLEAKRAKKDDELETYY